MSHYMFTENNFSFIELVWVIVLVAGTKVLICCPTAMLICVINDAQLKYSVTGTPMFLWAVDQ